MKTKPNLAATIAVALLAAPASPRTPPPEPAESPAAASGSDLAKQLSNPIASLVSVPFQANWDHEVGPGKDTRFLLNFQPVMPFTWNRDWNLIVRVIVPILDQPALVEGGTSTFGMGDLVLSAFFSPARPGKSGIVWGVGPVFQLPVSSNPFLGSEKWGIGPTAVELKQSGGWTYGGLVNHVWSYAGDSERTDVNQTFLQPFVSYTTKSAVTFGLNTEATANWKAASGEEWTVPINVQVSKVVKLGKKPLSVGTGAGYYAARPEGAPKWKFRALLTLLFPK